MSSPVPFRKFIEDENCLRSATLEVWDRFDSDLDDLCWQGVLIFDALNDGISRDATPDEITAKLAALARARGCSEDELKDALRRIPIPHDLKVGRDLIDQLAAVFSSEFLLLMVQRYFRYAVIELTSLRVTPAFGYLRLEAECVGLIHLVQRTPHLGGIWFTLDAKAGKRFYKDTQGRLKRFLESVPELDAAYELGSGEALHARLASAGRSLMFIGKSPNGKPLTVLAGHEANLADLRGYFDGLLRVLEYQPAVWVGLVDGFRDLDLSSVMPMIEDFRARIRRLRERLRAIDHPIPFSAATPEFTIGGRSIWERLVGDTAAVEHLFGRPPKAS